MLTFFFNLNSDQKWVKFNVIVPGSWRGSSFCPRRSSSSSEEAGRCWPARTHVWADVFHGSSPGFTCFCLKVWEQITSPLTGWILTLHSDVTYIEVWHARLFELVPESPGDDVNRDVVGDDSADAGQGGLDRTEGGRHSVSCLRASEDFTPCRV